MIRLALCLFLAFLPGLARAESVVLGLSQDQVAITATFNGSQLLIFGAVKRDAPAPTAPLDVVIAISGPFEPVVVRKKSRKFGIWINTEAVHVDEAPSYYAVASSRPLDEALSQTDDLRYKITLDRAIRAVGVTDEAEDAPSFIEALKRIRKNAGLYVLHEGSVAIDQETLFRTSLDLPSNITEGDYPTRIFLTREGKVIDLYETTIDVRKVGLERWLYATAQNQALFYGVLSLVIAVAAGWIASIVFGMIFRR